MTPQTTPAPLRSFGISILLKCLLILTAAILTVAGVLTYNADRNATTVALDGMRVLARDVTELTTGQLQGAVRFGKVDDIDATLRDLLAKHPDSIKSAIVVDKESSVIAQTGRSVDPDLRTLAETARQTTSLETTGDGFWVAYPIAATAEGTASGAIAIAWSPDTLLAELQAVRLHNLTISASVFLIVLIAAGLFFRLSLADPLKRVASRTSLMTAGDLVTEIKGQNRRDEIGLLSRELDTLRAQLHAAEAVTKDAYFKSAGFLGSSAALSMTDLDLKLTHHNAAFKSFIKATGPSLLKDKDVTSAKNLVGANLCEALNDDGAIKSMISKGNFPVLRDLRIDNLIIALSINPVKDDASQTIGYILEWEDVTVPGTNNAIIMSLEADQMRADFNSEGQLTFANQILKSALPSIESALGKIMLDQLIHPTSETVSLDQAASGKAVFDKFEVAHAGNTATVSGNVTPILDRDGRATGYVFLGKDITRAEAAKNEAMAIASAMEEARKAVVDSLSAALTALSQGDLSIRLSNAFDEDYEALRSHFNEPVLALDSAVSLVMDNSGAILGEAGNISSAADDLSLRTEQQAATLEQFAAALTQITASVASAADGASKASEVVTDARKNAEASGTVVREAVDAMGEIASSSEQISRIISVIDDIAFQTNLLALNAGVEAARAGDAGRGFAVVASEVRALAQRSSEAAREINTLISTSGNQVKRGVSLVDKAGTALNEIVTSVGDIEEHVTGIAASAREQSTGLEEINTAISQLDQVTQQNVAMFEETTAATHTLTAEANALVATTGRFRITGSAAAPRQQTPHKLDGARSASTGSPNPQSSQRQGAAPKAAPVKPKPGSVTDGSLAIADDDDWEDF
ncbi:methyl-accepting chemotaxis protein [Boseongicola aestuarii]|uniref:Methyl-accepting chemotaxis protein IV n=1 Tax=Boseongicola aestuarii TaxID=1470561 RepID=A0A238IZP4_9RHOB|nr:methyl-accepting chemotaxis protein [Boseongicola aestuarii]SMX23866.1 Methyl-accepting chemotaxis protein IV [Boseongicola aestuarii]